MTDFEKYIQRYLDLVPDEEWIDALDTSGGKTFGIFSDLTEEQGLFAYDNGKWTLKELLQHLIELWAKNSHANDRSLENLIDEFSFVRKGSILFFDDLSEEVLQLKGAANGNALSVETIGKLIVGHNIHHLNIIEERYLSKL